MAPTPVHAATVLVKGPKTQRGSSPDGPASGSPQEPFGGVANREARRPAISVPTGAKGRLGPAKDADI